MVKLSNRGHNVIRMYAGPANKDTNAVLTAADFGMADPTNPAGDSIPQPQTPSINLFADAQVPSFFR